MSAIHGIDIIYNNAIPGFFLDFSTNICYYRNKNCFTKEDILDYETLLRDRYNFNLKPQQRDAVLHIEGPAMLTAVPGGGKTTVIVLRCANMTMSCGIAPEDILTLTYSDTTARDLELCYCRIFSRESLGGLRFTTMHDLCDLIVREHCVLMNRKLPKLIDEERQEILRNLYSKMNGGETLPDNRLMELSNSISSVKCSMIADDLIEKASYPTRNFKEIYEAYEDFIKANDCMDQDGLQAMALAALSEKTDFLERLRKQYRYIQVDEAQELSKLQQAILSKLAAPRNNLFIAGDADQCLYSSRTASPEYMRSFTRAYPGSATMQIDRNYRSTHVIVNAAGHLIKHNPARNRIVMNTGNEIGMPMEETVLPDYGMLGSHIVSQLKSLPEPESSAVLFREHTSAAAVLDALNREGIPFRMGERAPSFFDHWVVQDILAFLALGNNPEDIESLKRVYRKLNAYITQDTFDQAVSLMDDGNPIDSLDALMNSFNISKSSAQRIKKLKEGMAELPAMQPGEAVQHILNELEYVEYLKKFSGEGICLENLLQIVESLTTIASRVESYPKLLERIAELTAITEQAYENRDQKCIMLSTVHAVKGMEFRNVLIADLFEGCFPSMAALSENSDGKKALLEEERRLIYVAVTRASKYVELIYTMKVNGERVKPSRFIRELLPFAPHEKKRSRAAKLTQQAKLPSKRKPTIGVPSAISPSAPKPAALGRFVLEAGTEVEHKAFGPGKILAYDGKTDIVTVRFQNFGKREFAASYCLNGGVLTENQEQTE